MIALKRKQKATKCSDHNTCTISVITHTANLIVRILRRRTEGKIEDVFGEDQFGFGRAKETRVNEERTILHTINTRKPN